VNTDTTLPPHLEEIGRQLTAAAHELRAAPRSTRRSRGLLVVVPVVAAVAAVALVFSSANTSNPGQHGQATRIPHPTAAQVLDRAAFAALQRSPLTPLPNQFVYTKVGGGGGQVSQSWMSVDGTRNSLILQSPTSKPTRLPGCADSGCTPQPAYFPEMPTTPSAMLPYLEKTQRVRLDDINDLAKTVSYMLDTDYLLPAQQSALFQFLATTRGLTVDPSVQDVAGRPGIGIEWPYLGSSGMLIFDASSYQYLGLTTRGINGDIGGDALLQTAIVNAAGQQPTQNQQPSAPGGQA
jgi:hypothetical protein